MTNTTGKHLHEEQDEYADDFDKAEDSARSARSNMADNELGHHRSDSQLSLRSNQSVVSAQIGLSGGKQYSQSKTTTSRSQFGSQGSLNTSLNASQSRGQMSSRLSKQSESQQVTNKSKDSRHLSKQTSVESRRSKMGSTLSINKQQNLMSAKLGSQASLRSVNPADGKPGQRQSNTGSTLSINKQQNMSSNKLGSQTSLKSATGTDDPKQNTGSTLSINRQPASINERGSHSSLKSVGGPDDAKSVAAGKSSNMGSSLSLNKPQNVSSNKFGSQVSLRSNADGVDSKHVAVKSSNVDLQKTGTSSRVSKTSLNQEKEKLQLKRESSTEKQVKSKGSLQNIPSKTESKVALSRTGSKASLQSTDIGKAGNKTSRSSVASLPGKMVTDKYGSMVSVQEKPSLSRQGSTKSLNQKAGFQTGSLVSDSMKSKAGMERVENTTESKTSLSTKALNTNEEKGKTESEIAGIEHEDAEVVTKEQSETEADNSRKDNDKPLVTERGDAGSKHTDASNGLMGIEASLNAAEVRDKQSDFTMRDRNVENAIVNPIDGIEDKVVDSDKAVDKVKAAEVNVEAKMAVPTEASGSKTSLKSLTKSDKSKEENKEKETKQVVKSAMTKSSPSKENALKSPSTTSNSQKDSGKIMTKGSQSKDGKKSQYSRVDVNQRGQKQANRVSFSPKLDQKKLTKSPAEKEDVKKSSPATLRRTPGKPPLVKRQSKQLAKDLPKDIKSASQSASQSAIAGELSAIRILSFYQNIYI